MMMKGRGRCEEVGNSSSYGGGPALRSGLAECNHSTIMSSVLSARATPDALSLFELQEHPAS